MISFLTSIFFNSEFSETLGIYWNNFVLALSNVPVFIAENQTIATFYEHFSLSFNFDEFQCKLLKGFSFILLTNVLLTYIVWKIYGKRISERFMKPTTSRAIEELKASVSKLKLPKEHSPRI